MGNSEIRTLARRLAALEKLRLQSKQPNLGFSTVDGGAIQIADDDDNLRMIVGQQFDGTRTAAVVSGPTPPVPSMPLAAQTFNGIRIYWDGTFADGSVAPMDFQRVTIHASTDGDPGNLDPLDPSKYVGEITSAAGGEVFASLPVGVEQFLFLVSWSQAGIHSDPSDPDFATPGGITATEIEDGSITTPKLAANAVTATKIASDAIDGKVITGATFQTDTDGTRIVIDSASHTERISLIPDSGETAPGTLKVVSTGEIVLEGPDYSGSPGASISLYNDQFSDNAIFMNADSIELTSALGLLINSNSRPIRGFDFGSYSDTTDSNSAISVPHGCDGIPSAVIAIGGTSATNARVRVTDRTSSTFELKFRNSATNVDIGSGEAVSGFWVAIR